MDTDIADLPDDIDALKAALTVERAKVREVAAERDAGAAELAMARAKASEDFPLPLPVCCRGHGKRKREVAAAQRGHRVWLNDIVVRRGVGRARRSG